MASQTIFLGEDNPDDAARTLSVSEQQFCQSQKMEAIEKLAGGLAHDFNNILVVITGYSNLLLAGAGAEDPVREPLEMIKRAAERGEALIDQLLTLFKIYLPRVGEAVGPEQATAPPAAAGLRQGSETVLLVEDETTVRGLIKKVLQMQGYTVLEASRGDEAVWLCEHRQGPIHLLVTDVEMPGMSGRELARRVAALQPEIRMLFMSGYTEDAVVGRGVLNADAAFLQKPFPPDLLARKVRELLGRPDSDTADLLQGVVRV
jgi:CheY-like chemotaxis protein